MSEEIKPPDALMFRAAPDDATGQRPPEWKVVPVPMISLWRWRGWHLLAREDEIRYADLNDFPTEGGA